MISLDTNILVYAVDVAAGDRHMAAKKIVGSASSVMTALTEQSLLEFVVATTRHTGVAVGEAAKVVRKLMANFPVLTPQPAIVDDVLALVERYHLGIWDARLLACCAMHGCEYLLSEDMQDGATYRGVTVVNPFNSANRQLLERLLTP